jgi:hypothetical protein
VVKTNNLVEFAVLRAAQATDGGVRRQHAGEDEGVDEGFRGGGRGTAGGGGESRLCINFTQRVIPSVCTALDLTICARKGGELVDSAKVEGTETAEGAVAAGKVKLPEGFEAEGQKLSGEAGEKLEGELAELKNKLLQAFPREKIYKEGFLAAGPKIRELASSSATPVSTDVHVQSTALPSALLSFACLLVSLFAQNIWAEPNVGNAQVPADIMSTIVVPTPEMPAMDVQAEVEKLAEEMALAEAKEKVWPKVEERIKAVPVTEVRRAYI